MAREHVDVLIVGAGLSGIGAACRLRRHSPGKSVLILEGRDAIGGTWDIFRYPGIRSDSDMHTLGYSFRPWSANEAIADGATIRDYIRDTAREHGVDGLVRFGHRVLGAEWSGGEARWTVRARRPIAPPTQAPVATPISAPISIPTPTPSPSPADKTASDPGDEASATEVVELTCSFLFVCTGYYRYDEGYTPDFPGIENFAGTVVHPQAWPEDLDYTDKRVVVIGSGATAVTLVPSMADTAAHVTMLQRSPTYVMALPARDAMGRRLRRVLPDRAALPLIRAKNVGLTMLAFHLSRSAPRLMKSVLRRGAIRQLPEGYDVDTHFAPRYDPWDQRMCFVPDGDLFAALRGGRASIVTDTIAGFTRTGLRLDSGAELPADIVVTATGLNLLAIGGMTLTVDGTPIELSRTVAYKGMMLSGVPNFALALGYTNASWTLKCDLVSRYVCRLLNHMDAHGYQVCMPQAPPADAPLEPLLDLKSGYVLRGTAMLPKQGPTAPWRLHQNYPRDVLLLRHGSLQDRGMRFGRAAARPRAVDTSTR
ncbi:FAD-containing monooxygenase EthA [Embleya scabrispora]|uniref:FAD-containing monooxygenase EthA n=1 Tax=Embleya scabrispora TaxID=159449 RepID=A0A1T3NP72_9ACTN|nr:NAD(P)/FAD-dependent oxidoreductase [Embleya scabrispora]OPC78564.1 FAD-containing monooxygenase EthA [Embleya scabrispora]